MDQQRKIRVAGQMVDLPVYDYDCFMEARERLLRHRQSSLKFQAKLSSATGVVLPGDYSLGRISHNYFSDCRFDAASLHRAAGTGSIFRNTSFFKTDLSNSTFQNSTFEHCAFESCDLTGCNMSECYFQDTTWNECVYGPANMTSSYLNGCAFLRTMPGNLADTILDNIYLEDIRLTNINLEFSTFHKITTRDVVLSFIQLPYIFGGLQYLTETSDNVRVSSHINPLHSISIDEYMAVLKDMEIFYSYQQEYFPLANILFAFHRYDEALAATLYGIEAAALQRDFRMCKYYCKLITSVGRFPDETLRKLYQAICCAAPVQELTEAQYYQYIKYLPEIRSILIDNPSQFPSAILRIETGICENETEQISLLLSTLDRFLHLNGASLALPSISISHNSPEVFIINLCAPPLNILAIATLILSIISGVCKTYTGVAEAILKTQEIAKNHRRIKQEELENRKLAAEIENLERENPELKDSVTTAQKELIESGLVIVRAHMEGKDFDPTKWL